MKTNNLYTTLNQFDSARLTLARELRGYQKKKLAELLDVSASAITQFESGKVRPNPETLAQLALILGVPIEFFKFRGKETRPISTDVCHFRSLRSATQLERRRVLSQGELLAELVIFFEQHVDIPKEDISQYAAKVPIRSLGDIEAYALEIRSQWGIGLGPIQNITALVENHGVLVFRVQGHSETLDAFSLWNAGRPCIFLSTEKESASRTRFDVAHELFHLLEHADIIPGDRELESQANAFAGAFLLPREPFLKEFPRRMFWGNWEPLLELKRRWKASLAAIIHRAYQLDCISEATYRRAFMKLNKEGLRTHEPDEPPMEYPVLIMKTLDLFAGQGWTLAKIAEVIGLSEKDLRSLLTHEIKAVEEKKADVQPKEVQYG